LVIAVKLAREELSERGLRSPRMRSLIGKAITIARVMVEHTNERP
jgi:hypothetical protein